jgi:hypothetical protein
MRLDITDQEHKLLLELVEGEQKQIFKKQFYLLPMRYLEERTWRP